MSKKYELTFALSGQIDPRIAKSFNMLSEDVMLLERDLESLRKTKGFSGIEKDARQASNAFADLQGRAQEFHDVFQRTLDFTGAKAIIDGATGSFANMVSTVGELDDSLFQVQAATGASAVEMVGLEESIREVYNGNYGEGFRDIADSMVSMRHATGLAGDALQGATEDALMLRDVFGYDIAESTRTVGVMMKNMGISADQAFNLIAQGSQMGLDRSGDFLDTINEYTPYFSKLGFSANQMFDTLASGLEAGAFNLDKVGDGIKEFGIRTKDGSKASLEAYQSIGLSGKAMTDQFAAGGAAAQKAFLTTVKAINSVEDPAKRNAAAVALFGTQAEDLEERVIKAYGNVNKQFDMTKDTVGEIAEIKFQSLTKEFQGLGRELMTEVVIPIGEDLMPVLHDLTDWAKNNKETIKFLALAVPATMIGKNVITLTKGVGAVKGSLIEAAASGGMFSKSLAMMKSPVGIAVGAIGLVTAGVIAYKEHQEAARQELLHMGDTMRTAYDNYSSVEEHAKKTKDLITEYDRLNTKISNSKTPAEELTEARRKLKNVEQELIDLNPDIIKSEDAKNGILREQAGLASEINESRLKMSRMELEKTVADNKMKVPALEEDYVEYKATEFNYENAYRKDLASFEKYNDYVARKQEIVSTPGLSNESMDEKLWNLAQEIETETGKNYSGNWSELVADMERLQTAYNENYSIYTQASSDIAAAESSLQAAYDAEKQLLEMKLGGSFEEMAGKYKDMSADQRKTFDEVTDGASELNRVFHMIPDHKLIDIEMLFRQSGRIPDELSQAGRELKRIELRDPGFNGYAEGGRVTSPELAWIGEGGDNEYIIPMNNSPRSKGLYAAAGRELGIDQGGSFSLVYNPQITIQGNADQQVIKEALRDSQREWESRFYEFERKRGRRNLAGV